MKKMFSLSCTVIFVAVRTHAQQPAASPASPLPPGPLVDKLPNSAKWEVLCMYSNPSPAAPVRGSSQPGTNPGSTPRKSGDPRNRKTIITKSGSTLNEETTYGDGRKESRWRVDRLEVVTRSASNAPEINYGPRGKSEDFPGLGWISRGNYTGEEEANGRKVYVFRDKVKLTEQLKWQGLDYGSPPPMVDAVAKIDMVSMLPFSIQIGDEMRTFQYDAALTTPLPVPASIQSILDGLTTQAQKTPPPRPRP